MNIMSKLIKNGKAEMLKNVKLSMSNSGSKLRGLVYKASAAEE